MEDSDSDIEVEKTSPKMEDGEDGGGDPMNIWKNERYENKQEVFEFEKKVTSRGTGWKSPKVDEVTFVDLSVKANEDAEPLGHIDNYKFKMSEVAFTQFVAGMKRDEVALFRIKKNTPAIDQLCDIFPVIKDVKEPILSIRLIRWQAIEYTGIDDDDKSVKLTLLLEGEDTYKTPIDESVVTMNIKMIVNDQVVMTKDNYQFELGDDNAPAWICDGLEYGLKKMKRHETSLVEVKPHLGPGQLDMSDDIATSVPSDVVMTYEVTLLDFTEVKPYYTLSTSERIDKANVEKTKGNELFKCNKYRKANKRYERAYKCVEYLREDQFSDKEQHDKGLETKKICELNLAQCHLKLSNFKKALELCNNVLKNDSNNAKALFRKASALMGLGEYGESHDILTKLPRDKGIDSNIAICIEKLKQQDAKDKALFSKMFG